MKTDGRSGADGGQKGSSGETIGAEIRVSSEGNLKNSNPTSQEKFFGKVKPTQNETNYSWFVLLTAFLTQCLYGIALFAPPVYYVKYVEYFSLSQSGGAWTTAIYAFCAFSVGEYGVLFL